MPFDFTAACAGATTMGVIGLWTNLGYHYWRGTRQTDVLNSEHPFTERCSAAYQKARQECGCPETDNVAAATSDAAEVFLVYFRTLHGSISPTGTWWNFFSEWSGTSHWAIEVRGHYFELCQNRDTQTDTGYNLVTRPVRQVRMIFRAALGATHFTNMEIEATGKHYAEGYVWDPFIRNCQIFLWEAYLGRRYKLGRKQEIRCKQERCLELPVFTSAILASVVGLTYILSSLLSTLFIPATLTAPTFWLSVALQSSSLIAGILVFVPFLRNRYLYNRRVRMCSP